MAHVTFDPTVVHQPPSQQGNGNSIFEPPGGGAWHALVAHKLVILVFALVFAAGGVAFGLTRPPTYTASATLQVGQVNPNSPGFLGYAQASSSLAEGFSRSVEAGPVLAAVEKKLGIDRSAAAAQLTSASIPLTSVFRVIGTGTSGDEAMTIADVAAAAAVKYVRKSNSSNPESGALLSEFQKASRSYNAAGEQLAKEESNGGSRGAVAEAKARHSAAKIRLKAIAGAYVANVQSQAPRTGLISLLAEATSASNDRHSKIQLFGFLGLLAGLVIGSGVAVWRDRGWRRGPEDPPPSMRDATAH